jgi:uncharacterized protein
MSARYFHWEDAMKIAVFGGTGRIGQRIVDEALRRGHVVTVVVRDPTKVPPKTNLSATKGDVTVIEHVVAAVSGQEAVVSAVSPGGNAAGNETLVKAARALLDGLKVAGVGRLIVVGGGGSLKVADGKDLVDSPEFPAGWKAPALAHRESLKLFREEGSISWTWMAPPALIEPGERTGKFRTGADRLITDAKGDSRISMEDYAVALIDELEKPRFVRKVMTAAY